MYDLMPRQSPRALFNTVTIAVVLVFFISCITPFIYRADASVDPDVPSGILPDEGQYSHLDVETFTLPPHLGEVRFSHRGDSDRIVIHVQDAHCNYFAQSKIADIIEYLNKEYGIQMLNIEGGAGDYDLSVFTNISGAEIRREVAEYFVKKGEVNGAELYAIKNPEDVVLWGIEDKDLYLRNLKVYRDSLNYKPEVDAYLKELRRIFNDLKRHIYPSELLKVDMAYNAYKAGNMDFKEYLDFLAGLARAQGVSVKKYANLYLISQAMEKESSVDFKRANAERSVLVDKMKGILSRNEMGELVSKTVEFKTKRLSVKDFYNYLLAKARECGIDTSGFPALSSYIVYVSLFEAVDSFYVMEELDRLEAEIKEPLYRKHTERELNLLSRNLAMMGNIFELLLTKNDFAYYRDNKDKFLIHNFLDFIEKEAPPLGIASRPSKGIRAIDGYLEDITEFYKMSFERDEAFLRNMRFAPASEGKEAALIMTGGFHTENLAELFKREGYSYVSIMPKFTSEEDYDNPYFAILAGQTADIQQMLRSALAQSAMLQVVSLLNKDPSMANSFYGSEFAKQDFDLAVDLVAFLRVQYGTLSGVDIRSIAADGPGVMSIKVVVNGRDDIIEGITPADLENAKRSEAQRAPSTEDTTSVAEAVLPETIVGAISGLLANVKTHSHPNVNVIGLSQEEFGIERSYTENVSNDVKRLVRKVGNSEYYEVFYNRDDPGKVDQIKQGLEELYAKLKDKENMHVNILADRSEIEYLEPAKETLLPGGKLVGIVGLDLQCEEKERYSRVTLAFLGIGLMERERATGSTKDAITKSLVTVIQQMTGENDKIEIQNMLKEIGPDEFISRVLTGDFIIKIKKIDFEGIRAFIAAEREILRSL